MKKYKTIIFDLDGTLLDTLKGITDAVNLTFKQLGYDIRHDYVTAKNFIGSGALEFVNRAMKGMDLTFEKKDEIGQRFLLNYKKLQNKASNPYLGVSELLKDLKEAGYKICLASNKPQALLDAIIDEKFPDIKFDIRFGQRNDVPIKPDPTIVNIIRKELNIKKEECLYVGDSIYDYETAKNANVDCMIVKYGYGFYDQEFVKKSTFAVDHVEDIRKILL